jgi:hypothetical protein
MIRNLLKELAIGDCQNATADIIETILNHEFIHEVLHRVIDKKTTSYFIGFKT